MYQIPCYFFPYIHTKYIPSAPYCYCIIRVLYKEQAWSCCVVWKSSQDSCNLQLVLEFGWYLKTFDSGPDFYSCLYLIYGFNSTPVQSSAMNSTSWNCQVIILLYCWGHSGWWSGTGVHYRWAKHEKHLLMYISNTYYDLNINRAVILWLFCVSFFLFTIDHFVRILLFCDCFASLCCLLCLCGCVALHFDLFASFLQLCDFQPSNVNCR